jgi:S1-C subfamily serine protease
MHGDPTEPLDDSAQAVAARHRKSWLTLGAIVGAVVVLIGLYVLVSRPDPEPGTGATLSARRITEVMAPLVGRLQAFVVSGEARPAGMAVTSAEGEMVTTCHNLPKGGPLQVVFRDGTSKAESARVNRPLDICVLKVATTGRTAAKLRAGDPVDGEKVYAAFLDARDGPARLIETRVKRVIQDPNGTAFQLDTTEPLVSGTPIVDTQGRVVGLVTLIHRYGDGMYALSSTRIATAREAKK